jgi:hypothetical protein
MSCQLQVLTTFVLGEELKSSLTLWKTEKSVLPTANRTPISFSSSPLLVSVGVPNQLMAPLKVPFIFLNSEKRGRLSLIRMKY